MSIVEPGRTESTPGGAPDVRVGADTIASGRPPLWTPSFVRICLISLLIVTSFHTLTPTLPLYLTTLGTTEFLIGVLMGIVPFTAMLSRPWVGWQIDSVGRRGILLAGQALYVLAFMSYMLAPSVPWLGVVRLVHGVAFGIVTTTGATVVADLVPVVRRGEGVGYYALCGGLGQSLGPLIGIAVMNRFGIGPLFAVAAIGPLVAFLLAWSIRYQSMTTKSERRRPIFIERAALPPSIMVVCLALAVAAPQTFISIHAHRQGIENIGLFFTAYTVAMLVVRPFSGVLYDRHGLIPVAAPGLLLVALAMVVLSVASNLGMVVVGGILLGLGYGGTMPALQARAVHGVPAERRGAANSTAYSFIDIGFFLGPAILGWVAEAYGYPVMFLGASAFALTGLVALGVVRPRRVEVAGRPSHVQ